MKTLFLIFIDLIRSPKGTIGYLKAYFAYYHGEKHKGTRTLREMKILLARINELEKTGKRPYEADLIRDILFNEGFYTKSKMTGKHKNKFRYKRKAHGLTLTNFR